jgi:arylsulfatase
MTYDVKDPDTKYAQIQDLRPPEGAPNVLAILIDDAGLGVSSPFGGPCQTPNFEKLAANALKYNRFHTVAGSCPTGQSGTPNNFACWHIADLSRGPLCCRGLRPVML